MHAPCARDAPLVVPAPVEIDMTVADDFAEALSDAVAAGPACVVVDMSRTVFCDSSGIAAIMAALGQAGPEGPALVLAVPDAQVRRVLSLVGLDLLVPIHHDLDTALRGGSAAT
ncbi:STAS domain-containing protein [Marinactinospora endophytica]